MKHTFSDPLLEDIMDRIHGDNWDTIQVTRELGFNGTFQSKNSSRMLGHSIRGSRAVSNAGKSNTQRSSRKGIIARKAGRGK